MKSIISTIPQNIIKLYTTIKQKTESLLKFKNENNNHIMYNITLLHKSCVLTLTKLTNL